MAIVGISFYAQEQLGDVVFVEEVEVERSISAGETFGVVESIKSVSDLFAPVSGTITDYNKKLNDQPELLNADPYGQWIIKIKMNNPAEREKLLNAKNYKNILLVNE